MRRNSWQVFDEKGLLIQSAFNERLAGVRINPPTKRLIVGIQEVLPSIFHYLRHYVVSGSMGL